MSSGVARSNAPQAVAPVWMETEIIGKKPITPTITAFRFAVPWGASFLPGQCIDFRLTAEDGYMAQRYYSIATAPSGDKAIEVMVERQEGGEVSPFFHDTLSIGDVVEVRGPVGAPFTWRETDPGPILLIGGGSGVVPVLSMARHRFATGCKTPFTLIYSVKREADVLAREELLAFAKADPDFQLIVTVTRESTASAPFKTGRVNRELIKSSLRGSWFWPETAFICGSNAFVGDVSDMLLEEEMEMHQVRTERFGG